MEKLLLGLLIDAAAIFIVTQLLSFATVDGIGTAVVVALVYGILKLLFRWILVLITLPLIILTLGLFWFVINAFLLWMTDMFIDGFVINGFFKTIITSIFISIVDTLLNYLVKKGSDE